jgi:hypothetical protein
MAEAGSRIPAWRRLGLALKNETQSGVAAPEPSEDGNAGHKTAPYDGQNGSHDHHLSPVETAVNGKSSKLGKRKHQHEPAEDAQISKKGRVANVSSNDHSVTENSVTETSVPAEPEQTSAHLGSAEQPAPEVSQPKGGDPNYRKKKAKSKKQRRKQDDTAPKQTETKPERVSLSPGAATSDSRTLLASTETDHNGIVPATTPQQTRGNSRGSTKESSGSPSAIDRRKSVTFTPDTKRVDGHSAQNLFKKWVAEQKGEDADAGAAEVQEPSHSASNEKVKDAKVASNKADKKEKRPQTSPKPLDLQLSTERPQDKPVAGTPASAPQTKKKDPSYYISYLTQYHTDRDHWKFNKAKQNDVVNNATNIFRIPEEYSEALLAYVQTLKGAGAIELLTSKCKAALKALDKEEATAAMDDPKEREAMQEEALQARISKERKRRKVEGDMEALSQHPSGDDFIRRLRRKRAEALLTALGRTSPILPATQTNGINPLLQNLAPQRDSRKRKRRADISSDESSSDSSSSDDDSSSSEDGSADSDDTDSSSGGETGDNGSNDSGSDDGSGSEFGSDGSESSDSD